MVTNRTFFKSIIFNLQRSQNNHYNLKNSKILKFKVMFILNQKEIILKALKINRVASKKLPLIISSNLHLFRWIKISSLMNHIIHHKIKNNKKR